MCPSSNSQSENSDLEYGEPLILRVGSSIKERRLDKYLHGRFSNLSRRFIQDAIKQGTAKVNGKTAKPSFRLSPGDEINFVLPEPPSKDIIPEDLPLNIIYEESELIILNKKSTINYEYFLG